MMNADSDESDGMSVPPHNFSRSPVKEVICQYHTSIQGPFEICFPKPYPGWAVIRERLADSLDNRNDGPFRDLMLRYTDEFVLMLGDDPDTLIVHPHEIPPPVSSRQIQGEMTERVIQGLEKGTEIVLRYALENDTIIIEFQAESPYKKEYSGPELMEWFETAREDIHMLFDLIVSKTLRSRCE